MTNRKKITYIHNEKPDNPQTQTSTYFKSVEEFNETMQKRKENLYPHLEIEILDVEDIQVDLYASAFKEDSRYRYNG
jgi:iron-sulfur cluster repair protein YtfE (RIC family)